MKIKLRLERQIETIVGDDRLTVSLVAVAEVDDVVDGAVDDLQQVVDADQDREPLEQKS